MLIRVGKVLAVVVLLCSALIFGTSAFAAGASVVNESFCFVTFDQTERICIAQQSIFNPVATPSGIVNYVRDGQYTETVTSTSSGQVLSQTLGSFHDHYIRLDGTLKEGTAQDTANVTTADGSCTITDRYHVVNGITQYESSTYSCT